MSLGLTPAGSFGEVVAQLADIRERFAPMKSKTVASSARTLFQKRETLKRSPSRDAAQEGGSERHHGGCWTI